MIRDWDTPPSREGDTSTTGSSGNPINRSHRARDPQISVPCLCTHCHHRRGPAPPRCPRSRPSEGGSCSGRGCWGAAGAPLCPPAGTSGLSRREAGSSLSSEGHGGCWGWRWKVPASPESWRRDGSPLATGTLLISSPARTLLPTPSAPLPQSLPSSTLRIPQAEPNSCRTLGRGEGARGCARGGTPCWPPSPRSRCRSLGTRCAAPAEGREQRAGWVPSTPAGSGYPPVGSAAQGLTLWGPWVAVLPVPLLPRDTGTRAGPGTCRGGWAEAGGSAAVTGEGWPRVSPRFGGPLGGSIAALLCGRCLWGGDGAGMMGQSTGNGLVQLSYGGC